MVSWQVSGKVYPGIQAKNHTPDFTKFDVYSYPGKLGTECRILRSGSSIQGLGYRIQDPGCWILDPGSGILGPGFRILDLLCRACRFLYKTYVFFIKERPVTRGKNHFKALKCPFDLLSTFHSAYGRVGFMALLAGQQSRLGVSSNRLIIEY